MKKELTLAIILSLLIVVITSTILIITSQSQTQKSVSGHSIWNKVQDFFFTSEQPEEQQTPPQTSTPPAGSPENQINRQRKACDFNLSDCKVKDWVNHKTYCVNKTIIQSQRFGSCFIIQYAEDITIDLQGHTIIEDLSTLGTKINSGIEIKNSKNINIKNGTIKNFYTGILFMQSNNSIMENLDIVNNTIGVYFSGKGSENYFQSSRIFNTSGEALKIYNEPTENTFRKINITYAGTGISITKANSINITEINIKHIQKQGIVFKKDPLIVGPSISTIIYLNKIKIQNTTLSGIKTNPETTNIMIENISIKEAKENGIEISSSKGIIINSTKIEKSGTGILINNAVTTILRQIVTTENNENGISIIKSQNINLDKINSSKNNGKGLYIKDSYPINVYNENIKHLSEFSKNKEQGILIENSRNIKLQETHTNKNQKNGLSIKNSKEINLTSIISSENVGKGVSLEANEKTFISKIICEKNKEQGLYLKNQETTIAQWALLSENEKQGIVINRSKETIFLRQLKSIGNKEDGILAENTNDTVMLIDSSKNKKNGLRVKNSISFQIAGSANENEENGFFLEKSKIKEELLSLVNIEALKNKGFAVLDKTGKDQNLSVIFLNYLPLIETVQKGESFFDIQIIWQGITNFTIKKDINLSSKGDVSTGFDSKVQRLFVEFDPEKYSNILNRPAIVTISLWGEGPFYVLSYKHPAILRNGKICNEKTTPSCKIFDQDPHNTNRFSFSTTAWSKYELTGTCTSKADCNDSNPCTKDYCDSGICSHKPKCDDGYSCTVDSCDKKTGKCTHKRNAALCPSGQKCNPTKFKNTKTGCGKDDSGNNNGGGGGGDDDKYNCGNAVCEKALGENHQNCPTDCPAETQENIPKITLNKNSQEIKIEIPGKIIIVYNGKQYEIEITRKKIGFNLKISGEEKELLDRVKLDLDKDGTEDAEISINEYRPPALLLNIKGLSTEPAPRPSTTPPTRKNTKWWIWLIMGAILIGIILTLIIIITLWLKYKREKSPRTTFKPSPSKPFLPPKRPTTPAQQFQRQPIRRISPPSRAPQRNPKL